VVGTPEYLSPEQAMGSAVDARADVYAVGLIAWRALAGRHPFKADDARSLLMMQATRPVPPLTEPRPDLAAYPALVAAVSKACAKEPSARHQSAASLREDLAAALGPAFLLPPGATPAPAISLTISPIPLDGRAPLAGLAGATLPGGPQLPASPARGRALAWGRVRLAAIRSGRAARDAAVRGWGAAAALLRGHARVAGAAAAVLLAAGGVVAFSAWQHGRAAANARALLDANRPADARAVLEAALEHHPKDRELLVLRARALARLPNSAAEAIDAYAAARASGPLDAIAYEDLVEALGRERAVADRAARVLQDEGAPALPAILRAAENEHGMKRLRALALARDLGAEASVDRVAAYGDLLADPDCEVRRAAARRLGEVGDPAALPRLRKAAQARTETKGFFGTKSTPACGAADADAAARRIEAAQPR
jgi:eukaryotic-like serine/threonine-protein kinase